VNRRVFGCGTLGAIVFVGIGLFGIWRASAPVECPERLPYQPAAFEPVGSPVAEPVLDGVEVALERAGSASFGLARWEVYVEPGFAPSASGEPLPQRIVLDCGNGSYQAYHRGAE
jgi:hypothetical protein